jgi:hypothetical protein
MKASPTLRITCLHRARHRPRRHLDEHRTNPHEHLPRPLAGRPAKLAAAALAAAFLLGAYGDGSSDVIDVDASIDGISLDVADASKPLPLSIEEFELMLTMANTSDSPQAIRTSASIARWSVDSQAHGFLRAKLALYAPGNDRE